MTIHAKDTLRGFCILQIVNFFFTISATKARRTKGLVAGEDCHILDFFVANGAMVRAV